MSTHAHERFVGVDVSKASLQVHVRPDGTESLVPNTPADADRLAARLARLRPALVVLEATGGLERPLALALARCDVASAVVNPSRARAFAAALDQLAKTDPIDASVLAHFAEAVRPEPRRLDEARLELNALQTRRRQLVKMLAIERNHLASAPDGVHALVSREVEHLQGCVHELDALLRAKVAENEALSATQRVLETAKGIGAVTSAMLVALLPEIGHLTSKQIAKLVGVAPMAADSGKVSGKRHCRAGRREVRTALYLPTLTATRYNPAIRAFYERLTAKGKPHKVAIIACMRKFLGILNAMARNGRPWDDRHALSA